MPYRKAERLGSFRRFALAFWRAPRDGVIYGTMYVDATKMLEVMAKVEKERGIKLSLGHFVGKGMALGLRAAPQLNSKIIWGTIYQKDTVDIFFQVDVESGKDLSGVLVERADEKSVIEIGQELRAKAENLRLGKDKQYEKTQKGFLKRIPPFILRRLLGFLTFLEFNLGMPLTFIPGVKADAFGTAMLTNVGMMGVDIAYAPLIPVTRVGIVGLVGRCTDEPMVVDGKIQIRPRLTLSCTFDHRLGDGAHIGLMIRTARAYMENPHLDATPPAAPADAAATATHRVSGNGASAPPSEPAKPLPTI
jgi:pyruvate dehydrogenase E2 component (dihydrolipoamide acetyltransferase)